MLKAKVASFIAISSIAISGFMASANAAIDENLTVDEITAIAKKAYIYGYPMVDHYRITHSYSVDTEGDAFKSPINVLHSDASVYTHEDTTVQTPNSDTPYGFLTMDLRAEPLVLTIPKVEDDRYISLQFVDMYTHNFAYAGSRETGNADTTLLIATQGWDGEVPAGIDHVIRSETDFALTVYRTQLFNPSDIDNVKAIQAKYSVKSLSEYNGKAAKTAPAINFIDPAANPEAMQKSLVVFQQLGFLLQFAPTHESETELRAKFAQIGIAPGKTFNPAELTPEQIGAFSNGIKAAWGEFMGLKTLVDEGKVTSDDVFGTREYLKNNYTFRWAAAVLGIWGNSAAEAIYPSYYTDLDGEKLHGENNYELYFPAGQLPPVNSFWSLTMYKLPESLLIENDLNRYLLNSPMMDQFTRDEKGGITFYIQNESPGKDKEANWLPAPAGSFSSVLRLYWPQESALSGEWVRPEIQNVSK